MSQSPPKFISLATKNAIVYFILTLAGLSTLGYLLFWNSSKEIIESSEQQVLHAAEVVEIKFLSFLNDAKRDISYLAQSPFLKDFLRDFDESKKELLASEYLALLGNKPDYAQIRFIGVENYGKELIRAERLNGTTFLVKENKLQKKGNRNYFMETINLPKDSVYFSAIDLNKEYGNISYPLMPTFRVASPIFYKEKPFGIVIINVNLSAVFEELKALVNNNFNLKIINKSGHFLIHPDSSKTFTFEFGKKAAFEQDFGLNSKKITNSTTKKNIQLIKEKGLLYAFRPLAYPKPDYQLFITVGSQEEAILADFYAWRRTSLTLTFGIAFSILFIALGYMRRQAKELQEITETMTSFPENIAPAKLLISRNDEIGQLAKRFEEMSKIISDNLTALKSAKEKVEQAVREKDAFLENMSHEIRNPIHSIMGMTHLLEKNNPGRHQKAFIEALKFNSNNLLSLVNDILDYRKLSKGELLLVSEWINLAKFLKTITDSHQFKAAAKKLNLKLDVAINLKGYSIFIDPVRLTQIVNNLVINALKFTPENGSVIMKTTLLKKEKNELIIRLSVIDTGIGIEKSKIRKVVERYYTEAYTKDEIIPEGTGLGLPIVVQILKLFESKLTIDSKKGHGSAFTFDIKVPFKIDKTSTTEITNESLIQILNETNVLVIDDDEQTLFLYENIFQNKVHSLTKINHIDNINSVEFDEFDIIISDLNFGEETSEASILNLTQLLKKESLFFIISGTDKTISLPKEVNQFEGQLQKPINPSQLIENISIAYVKRRFGIPNTQTFWEDYDQNESKFQQAIQLLIKEWNKMTLDLEKAIHEKNEKAYTAIRHKLITSVRRLKLENFEAILELPFNGEKLNFPPNFKTEIRQRMNFYVWWLKNRV